MSRFTAPEAILRVDVIYELLAIKGCRIHCRSISSLFFHFPLGPASANYVAISMDIIKIAAFLNLTLIGSS
jgi:hypothetical protein